MIYLLLTISFIIHFLLFRVIIQLKNKIEALERGTGTDPGNIEEKLSLFLQEMREDNDDFLKKIDKLNANAVEEKSQTESENRKLSPLIQEKHPKTQQSTEPTLNQPEKQEQTEKKPEFKSLLEKSIASEEVAFESSTEAKVLNLYSQGESLDSIAKKLDIGKTEVELIVKIQQNQRK